MELCKIVTIVMKDEERTLRHKFLIYDDFMLSGDDPVIQKCVAETKKDFDSEPDSVEVKISMDI